MKMTYTEIYELAEYGRVRYGWISNPVQLACKKLREQGYVGKLEICSNNNEDGDGIPDVIIPSISNSANHANARYLQKGKDYGAWYPVLERNM